MPDDKIDVDAIIGPVLGILGGQGPVTPLYSAANCWNKQLARCVELKQRTKEARLVLERIDKLTELIATTPVDSSPAMELQPSKEEGST